MKKLNFKSFLMGFITCTLLTSTVSYAAQYKPIHVAIDVVKKIVINGADKTPTIQKPFMYEGTTYVPLAYIANALDKKVNWDSKTGTIYINDSGNEREDVYINRYGYEKLNAAGRMVVKDYNGNKVFYFEEIQPDKYKNNVAPSTISYKLDKEYKHLIGKFGFFNGGKNTEDIHTQLTIYDDNKDILYQSSYIRGNMNPISLNVDISKTKYLEFKINTTSFKKGASANIGFVDLRLSNE